jgi:hypothetical protein
VDHDRSPCVRTEGHSGLENDIRTWLAREFALVLGFVRVVEVFMESGLVFRSHEHDEGLRDREPVLDDVAGERRPLAERLHHFVPVERVKVESLQVRAHGALRREVTSVNDEDVSRIRNCAGVVNLPRGFACFRRFRSRRHLLDKTRQVELFRIDGPRVRNR